MKKKFNFIDENLQEEFMSIFAIGLTQCLEQKLIDTKRAEQWLFSPMVAYNLKSEGYDKKFLYAMEYASELDATRGADYFLNSVKTAQKLFTEVLNEINKVTIASGEHIIEGLCELE